MKKRALSRYSLILCSLLATCIPLAAHAEELLSLVAETGKGFRAAQDPIIIRFGKNMPTDLVPYLRLEIDAIDVSDYVQLDERQLVYIPQEQLVPGAHELRVVAVLPDGTIEEAAVWTVEVRASQAFRVAEFNGQLDLQLMQRVSDDLSSPPEEKQQAQGALALASQHADGDWRTTAHANIIYNSQQAQNLSGQEAELTDYQVKTAWSQSEVVLGHQTFAPGSLILNDFDRRGVSASYHSELQRFAATGFSTRTEAISGFDHPTGVDEPQHRTSGVMLSAYPFAQNPQWLGVTAIYLDGRGISQGVAQFSETTPDTGGDAQAIMFDSYLGNRLWRVRGEYASTAYDFDGENTGFSAQDDDAMNISVGYDTARDESGERQSTSNWGMSVMHQRVGPWFHSLGNTTVVADREIMQFLGNYQGEEFFMNGAISLGEDNVDNDSSLPTTAIDSALFNLTYVPRQELDMSMAEQAQEGLFSNPNFNLSWAHNRLDQIRTPSGFTGDDVNSRYDELSLIANFSGSNWYWSLSHSLIRQEDLINTDNRADTATTGLESQFMLGEHFSVAPQLQHSETDYVNLGTQSKSWLAGLALNVNYPEDWSYSLSFTVNRERASDDSFNNRTRMGQFAVQWQVRKPGPNRFGTSIFTTASYLENDVGTAKTDQYQVFVGVNVAWPVSL